MPDALGVLVRVVVAVLGGQRQPVQAVQLGRLQLAAARHGLGGDHALQLAVAAPHGLQLHDRAQPPGGDRVERLARADHLQHGDDRRPALEPQRVQRLPQHALAPVERDHRGGRLTRS